MNEALEYLVGIEIPACEYDFWLNQKEVDLTELLETARIYLSSNDTYVLKWNWVKWYPGVFEYIDWVEDRLEMLDPDTYTFLKLSSNTIREQGRAHNSNMHILVDIELDRDNLTQIA